MPKIDQVVKRETVYIALWSLIFSFVMQAIFLVLGKWDYTVLLGNLLSVTASVLNFLFLGITVQNALSKEEKEAKQFMRMSGAIRNMILFVACIVGVLLPYFSTWTVLIPLFFPRAAIMIRPLWDKKREKEGVREDAIGESGVKLRERSDEG